MALALCSLLLLGLFFYTAAGRVPYLLLHGGLLTPLFALLILGLSGSHPISSLFSWRPLLLLGETSYCLYLLHFNTFILIHRYHLPERLHVAAFDPWISYLALLAIAYAAFHLVENPARKAVLRRFSARPATAR